MKKNLLATISVLPLMILVFLASPNIVCGQQYTDTTYQESKNVIIPPCVTSITVEAWGGGGGGGKDLNSDLGGAGGGGGGAYKKIENYSVTPGESIIIIVGNGGAGSISNGIPGSDGDNSSVEYLSTELCTVAGGTGGSSGNNANGGAGGIASGSNSFSGGAGASGNSNYGGGGGGSAGSSSNGNDANSQSGAIIVPDGGPGGSGGKNTNGSSPTYGPGGGGGGGEYSGFSAGFGGDGYRGQVKITYNYAIPPTCTIPETTPVSYCQNATATPLSVTGTAGSGTISSYEWYSNTTQSNSGGTLLETHTSPSSTDSYTPVTSIPGTLYYYVIITNSYGCTSTSEASGAVTVNIDGIWTGAGDNSTWEDPDNWCGGVPTTGNIIIPESASVHITANTSDPSTCTNLVINGTLTIDAGKALTVTDILTNNGSLILNPYNNGTPDNPDDDGIASLIAGTYADNGNESISLFLSGENWHYISTPISNLSTDIFAVGNDLAQYVESRPTIAEPYSFQRGWIAWDGWSYYDYPNDVYTSGFSTLTLGKGYNYWNSSDANFTLSGSINTTGPALSLAYNGNATYSGYNLIGNPFTCGLDIQAMFDGAWPAGINKAVYFTSGGSYYVFGDDMNVPETDQSQIPPMQGFFVRVTSGGTYNLPWVKAHTSEPRFKGEKSSVPHVRLSISANGKSEETVVRFNENAKTGSDTEFDVPRFITDSNSPSIYTTLGETDYIINGLPFPATKAEIPVTVNLLTDGNHTITAMKVEELNNYKVALTDKSTGSSVDLNSGKEYSFSAPAGLIKDRFVLTVSNLSTAIEDPVKADNLFNIYAGFNLINVQPLSDQWDGKTGSIKLLDISGKTVRNQPNTEFMKNSLIQLPSPGNGIYFVEIRSGNMRYVGKVVVK